MTTDIGQASNDTTFNIDVPDIFHPLPLDAGEEDLDERLATMADELVPDARDEMRRIWIDFSRAILAAVAQQDARYAALCCERDGDSISPGGLVIGVPQLSIGDPEVAAAGIVQVLGGGSGSGTDDARVLHLPCGPAAAVVRERRLRLPDPAEMDLRTADGEQAGGGEQVLPVREAQIYIPYRPWQRAVLIALSTPAVDDWDSYARIFIRIARSVRFPDTEDPASAG